MKHINEQQQRRKSFVERMATKAKSQVYNVPSYKTISLLPKFFRPDSRSWTRFDQDMTNFSTDQGQEAGLDVKVDVSEKAPTYKRRSSFIPPRRSSLSIISKIISPANFGKRNKTFQGPSRKSSFDYDYPKENVNELKYYDKKSKQFVSNTVITIPEDTSINTAQVNPAASGKSKESEWKSYMKELEEGKIADGFFDECKNRMKRSWEIFTGETTAHGYKRTMAKHRSKLGRFLWVVAIVGVTSIVMASLYKMVIEQDLNAFSSSIKSQAYNRMEFPAVTVCNLAPYNHSLIEEKIPKNETNNVHLFLRAVGGQNISKLIDNNTLSVFNNYDTKELHDMIGWKLENFLLECYWDEDYVPCSDIFVRSLTMTESCFTFNFDMKNPKVTDRVGSYSGLRVVIDVGHRMGLTKIPVSGVKVLLHEPNEFPNVRENGMLVSTGTTTYISVAKNEYKFLPQPYKAYGTDYCSDSFANDQRYYNYTGFSSCMAECRLRAVLSNCSCVVYGRDPEEIPPFHYCSMQEYLHCYIPALRMTYKQTPLEIPRCDCPLPCSKVEYLTQMSSAAFQRIVEDNVLDDPDSIEQSYRNVTSTKHLIELKIFYKELFTHIEEQVPLYNWLTIFGNVGGQLGLFTGASVLTMLEFFELWMLMLWLVLHTTYRYFKNRWRSKKINLDEQWKSGTGKV